MRHSRSSGPATATRGAFCGRIRVLADLEVPQWSADINDAGDSAANVAREDIVQVTFDPRDFVFVRANAVEIGAIRPREQIAD